MEDLDADLQVKLVDQDELESSITRKANRALIAKESELDEKRLEKAKTELAKVERKIQSLERRLASSATKISQRKKLKEDIEWFEKNEKALLASDIADIQERLRQNTELLKDTGKTTSDRMEDESERDFLIRTGKITAFGNSNAFAASGNEAQSHQNLRAPGFMSEVGDKESIKGGMEGNKNLGENSGETLGETLGETVKLEDNGGDGAVVVEQDMAETGNGSDDEDALVHTRKRKRRTSNDIIDSDSAFEDADSAPDSANDDPYSEDNASEEKLTDRQNYQTHPSLTERNVDDGDEAYYQARLAEWSQKRSLLRNSAQNDPNVAEWHKPHPSIPDAVLDSRFRLPGDVYPSLFEYQKTCVQWLWELYSQKTGGIIGDEMGLGKTIQVIAFLAGLHYSGLLEKPVLLVVPATVMNQWVNEFHRWWPPFRCVILHSIGSGMGKNTLRSEMELEAHLETEEGAEDPEISLRAANNHINAKEMVERVLTHGHVLVTTYVGLRIYSKHILPHEWGYAVLDEGHKIRNPNLEISLTCKRIKTYNRVILSGTPIQNNLIELWSLFDFVFPGRLGTLPVFEQQFAIPINMGGYANATNVQVQTGYKCAVILRDLILPYLLRRLKVDVAQDLPKKNEMVLFVKLTQFQQDLYEKFLGSEDVNAILGGRRNVLMGVDMLRKICNHPDLVDRMVLLHKRGYNYGNPAKSGKMQVVKQLLQLWQLQGHRTLLFCQTKQMLDILEKFLANMRRVGPQGEDLGEFHYLRMDGLTPIAKRQQLVDTFNGNEFYHVFLLTTKVGGLGVNLTGADRVIIYDPDWNPSTDIQARERAWRLGQKKDITIYRLMTAGTIEEKIYHRQIFKTFLTNKILKDPKQRRFFKLNDLHDLFTLGDPNERGTETGDMFSGSEKTYQGSKPRQSQRLSKTHGNDDDFYDVANIMGVSKLGKFEGEPEEQKEDEGRLMEGIFANAGVHSTLQHDDVMDLSKHELSLVEKEASRAAKVAADALKRSRTLARKTAVGTPTWTGKFGAAGRFGPKKSDGSSSRPSSKLQSPAAVSELGKLLSDASALSSTSILTQLRQRQVGDQTRQFSFGKKAKKAKTSTSTSTSSASVPDKQELLDMIVGFLSKQANGFSQSNAILQSLPKLVDLKNERELVMVRSLLREVAEWDSSEKGWKLKAEFKN